jgi:hypothetical protein
MFDQIQQFHAKINLEPPEERAIAQCLCTDDPWARVQSKTQTTGTMVMRQSWPLIIISTSTNLLLTSITHVPFSWRMTGFVCGGDGSGRLGGAGNANIGGGVGSCR